MTPDQARAVVMDALREAVPGAEPESSDPADDMREQLDMDSMDHLNFMVSLHERTGADIPERDYPKLTTIDACVLYLTRS